MKKVHQPMLSGESLQPNLGRNLFGSRGLGITLTGLLLLVFVSACQKTEVKPLDIATGDICYRCKAPIVEKRYAAEFVTKDGFVRKFDDVSCMIQHAVKVGKGNISAYYATDYATQTWMNAEEGHYIRSDQIQTPKQGGIIGFKDEAKAKGLAGQVQAPVLSFADLMK